VRSLYQRGWDRQRIVDLFAVLDWRMRLPEALENSYGERLKPLEKYTMYSKEIALSVFDGVISIPTDLAYGVRKTFEDLGGNGKATRLNNASENKRASIIIENAIKFANTDAGPITKVLKIILEEFYQDIPDNIIEKAAKKIGISATYMTSRVAMQVALVNLIAKILTTQIATKVTARRLAKMGVGFMLGALIIQGIIEKASESQKD